MYTGFILWILGWAVYHGAMISLVIGLAGIGSIFYWQRLEDGSLESRFGDAYRE
jgi:protein-S-isoprenylcysteine O-methyltransferase Ste14